jgi:hypothetical protein
MANERKYFTVEQTDWEAFVADKHSRPSLATAQEFTAELSEQPENQGKAFVIVEEAGVLAPEVKRSVKYNFKTNRIIERGPRKAKGEGVEEAPGQPLSDENPVGKGRRGRRPAAVAE